ncbi:class I SAM-dependent methyltransferase [bacterium]|nr:class I SAM-dependent methyltransferase [bacterium]
MKKFAERKLVKKLKRNFQAAKDSRLLEKKFEFLRDYPKFYATAKKELEPYYNDYTKGTSAAFMAASIEISVFNLILCDFLKPASVIDLGSGFSSFVFRYFSRKNNLGTKVFSVDDDALWLKKTAEYLEKNKIQSDNMLTLDDIGRIGTEKFDIIFHDMGNMQTRTNMLGFTMDHVKETGIIVLDDMHKADYEKTAKTIMKEHGFKCLSLRKYTLDELGRFSYCSFK